MGNMSYCRFENTKSDLEDCINNRDDPDLSQSEKRAKEEIFYLAEQIINQLNTEF